LCFRTSSAPWEFSISRISSGFLNESIHFLLPPTHSVVVPRLFRIRMNMLHDHPFSSIFHPPNSIQLPRFSLFRTSGTLFHVRVVSCFRVHLLLMIPYASNFLFHGNCLPKRGIGTTLEYYPHHIHSVLPPESLAPSHFQERISSGPGFLYSDLCPIAPITILWCFHAIATGICLILSAPEALFHPTHHTILHVYIHSLRLHPVLRAHFH
jgi:hypothetical protein